MQFELKHFLLGRKLVSGPDKSMNTLFITGGAGFIGSAFVRLLLQEIPDCAVTNFDALTYAGNPDNLEDIERRASPTCDQEAILQIVPPYLRPGR